MTARDEIIFDKKDAFEEADEAADSAGGGVQKDVIHIRVQQRNGRKCITSVQGLNEQYDLKKVMKEMKGLFNTNASVTTHDEFGKIIQMQGDQRDNIKTFLCKNGLAPKDKIVVHGFWRTRVEALCHSEPLLLHDVQTTCQSQGQLNFYCTRVGERLLQPYSFWFPLDILALLAYE